MTRRLIRRYDYLHSNDITLSEIKNHMENKINCVLNYDVDSCCIVMSYDSYESDIEYNARLRREENEATVRNLPEFKEYLKLHERFKYYV